MQKLFFLALIFCGAFFESASAAEKSSPKKSPATAATTSSNSRAAKILADNDKASSQVSITLEEKRKQLRDLDLVDDAFSSLSDLVKALHAKLPKESASFEIRLAWKRMVANGDEGKESFLDYVEVLAPAHLEKTESAISLLHEASRMNTQVGSQSYQWSAQFLVYINSLAMDDLNDAYVQFEALLTNIEAGLVAPSSNGFNPYSREALLFELSNSFWMNAFLDVGFRNQRLKRIPGSSPGPDYTRIEELMKERTRIHHNKVMSSIGYPELAEILF